MTCSKYDYTLPIAPDSWRVKSIRVVIGGISLELACFGILRDTLTLESRKLPFPEPEYPFLAQC